MFFSAKLMDEHYEGYNEGKEAGRQEGIEEGMQKGIKKGRKEEVQEIAKRMHAKGKSTDEIAEMLGLTVEKIRSIIGEDGV